MFNIRWHWKLQHKADSAIAIIICLFVAPYIAADVPEAPPLPTATTASPSAILVNWTEPAIPDGSPPISGYGIEVSVDSGSFITLIPDTKSPQIRTQMGDNRTPEAETVRTRTYLRVW